jgi:hypothetical protein
MAQDLSMVGLDRAKSVLPLVGRGLGTCATGCSRGPPLMPPGRRCGGVTAAWLCRTTSG